MVEGGQLEVGYSFQQDCLEVPCVQEVLLISSDKAGGPKRHLLNIARGEYQTHTSHLVPSVA